MKYTLFALLLTSVLGLAQPQDILYFNERVPAPPGPGEPKMIFFGSTGAEAIRNAPYSADMVTEMTQTLPDGNRIRHENKSSFARDSEGRTRRETFIQALGAMGRTDGPLQNIVIHDPVAKLRYMLDSKNKVAVRMPDQGPAQIQLQRAPGGSAMEVTKDVLVTAPDGAGGPGPRISVTQFRHVKSGPDAKNLRQEDLGLRTIEGVSAKGTRTTFTIPAGELGNERPIEVVTETWFSEQIKAPVLTRHSDPRTGDSVTKLTNLKLGEPARSLFEVPADYQIEEPKTMDLRGPVPQITIRHER